MSKTHYCEKFKITDHKWPLNSENYSIPHRHRLLGQTTNQPLNNFELRKLWKYKQLWGLRPDSSCLYKKVYFVTSSDAVIGPCRISMIELFAEVVNRF